MQKRLEQLYDGEICPSERSAMCITHFKAAGEVAVQAHDAFEEKLCAAMKMELDDYLSKQSDVNTYHTKQDYIDGFRLVAQLMLEILEVSKDD